MRSRVEKCDGASIYCPPGRHEIARSLFQLLSAVSFLHQNEVAHRDIKPDAGFGQLRIHVGHFVRGCCFEGSPSKNIQTYPNISLYEAKESSELHESRECLTAWHRADVTLATK